MELANPYPVPAMVGISDIPVRSSPRAGDRQGHLRHRRRQGRPRDANAQADAARRCSDAARRTPARRPAAHRLGVRGHSARPGPRAGRPAVPPHASDHGSRHRATRAAGHRRPPLGDGASDAVPERARAIHGDAADVGARVRRHLRGRDRPRGVRGPLRREEPCRPGMEPGARRRRPVRAPEIPCGVSAVRPHATPAERRASREPRDDVG